MSRSLLALLFLEAFGVAHAMIYAPSKQTSPAENTPDGVNGWSPKPTEAPRLRGQARYGVTSMHELFKRSSDYIAATCGWINANGEYPITCQSGYACAYITSPSPQWFNCCPTIDGEVDWDNCPYYDTCYDFDSYSAPNTWTGSYPYAPSNTPAVFYCPSASPYCNTYSLQQQDSSTFQYMYCDTTQSVWDIYQYRISSNAASASGSDSASFSNPPQSAPGPVTVTKSVTVTKGDGTSSPGLSLSPGAASSTSGTASPTANNGGSSTNTGAIAGGVVGGVAGIALLGAAIGYLIYRKKKARVEPMREVSIYSQPAQYSSPGYSNNGGSSYQGYSNPNYANNYSQGQNY